MSDQSIYQCALVTGASGGLGEEFALQLASNCQRMVLVARRKAVLKELQAALERNHPGLKVISVAMDLSRKASRIELIDRLLGTEWAPDLLVNNAGMGDYGEFATADWEKLQQMLDLNVGAATHLVHGFLGPMVASGHGAVLNVSSLASALPIPDFAVYAASKAYLTSFSEALRLELRQHRIAVLAVCPGPVRTDFGETAGREGAPVESPSREWFYVPKEQVVRESLGALRRDRARVYPGWKVGLLAASLSILPMVAIRYLMSHRPRSNPAADT